MKETINLFNQASTYRAAKITHSRPVMHLADTASTSYEKREPNRLVAERHWWPSLWLLQDAKRKRPNTNRLVAERHRKRIRLFLVLGAKSNILTRSKHDSSLICVNLCHLRIILRLQPAKAFSVSLSMASSSIGDFTECCPQIAQIFADQKERYYIHQHILNNSGQWQHSPLILDITRLQNIGDPVWL